MKENGQILHVKKKNPNLCELGYLQFPPFKEVEI